MLRHNLFLLSILAFSIGAFSFAPHAGAATLTFGGGASAIIGQTISVSLLVATEGSEVLNAVSAELRFPEELLTLQSISKTGSIISFWAEEPSYSNTGGTASLQGIIPNPGWKGQSGTVVTLVFKVNAAGSATVSFASASVLANDGLGTNILSKTFSKTLSLGGSAPQATSPAQTSGAPLGPVLASSTHPDPSVWYSDAGPLFTWNVPKGVTAIRLLYDTHPISSPSVLYEEAIDRKQLLNIKDGTYYFHAQFQNASGWGAITHMRFQIDTAAPKPFTIAVVRGSSENQPQAIISFETTDATSGIDHYTVAVGNATPVTVTTSEVEKGAYPLPAGEPGQQRVVVKAFDRAGNTATESKTLTIMAIKPPTIEAYSRKLKSGEPFVVSGTTYPGASVEVTLKDKNGDTTAESTTADASSGEFSLAWTQPLNPGTYSFTAMAESTGGAMSLPTKPLTFAVADTPLSEWGSTVLEYLLVAFTIIAGVAFVIGVGYILWYRLSHLRRRLKHIAVRSGRGVQYDFEHIMDDLHSLAVLLHKTKQKRELTREEDVILEKLKQHLKKMEDDILSRLEQIDDEAGT